ncbi:MAG: glycosyltransferase family 25 protein [Candidatus Accumulibacter sp.]|jgi:glycosyl transferase family 25|nr:glycosyltransferase family 25 protein [Accumulibacter sp.]
MTKDLSNLNVDAVLCINLRSREDRRMAMLETFRDSGINIEFFIVDKDKDDPQRGCYNSHRACARLILERHYKRALILEDDCIIEPFAPKTIQRVNCFLNDKNPEIFYLGVLLGKIWLTWRWNIARCRAQGAHAYIISEQGCQKIIEFGEYVGKGIDSIFSKRFKGYCVFPMIGFQNDKFDSDLQGFRDKINKMVDSPYLQEQKQKLSSYARNTRKQYVSVFENIHKTLLFR